MLATESKMSRNMNLAETGRIMLGMGIAAAMLAAASSIPAPVYNMTADIIPRPDLLGPAIAKVTVTYKSNGGTGTMASQKVIVKLGNKFVLSANTFKKPGYVFNGWNTKKDGTGTKYANKASVSLTKNTTLYAQWAKAVTVTFNKNGGTGTMANQTMKANVSTKIKKNTLTRKGYTFIGWNTKKDGKGAKYNDQQAVKFSKNTTLYAQWRNQRLIMH